MAHTDTPMGNSKKAATPAAGRSTPVTPTSAKSGKSKRASRASHTADDAILRATRPEGGVGAERHRPAAAASRGRRAIRQAGHPVAGVP